MGDIQDVSADDIKEFLEGLVIYDDDTESGMDISLGSCDRGDIIIDLQAFLDNLFDMDIETLDDYFKHNNPMLKQQIFRTLKTVAVFEIALKRLKTKIKDYY